MFLSANAGARLRSTRGLPTIAVTRPSLPLGTGTPQRRSRKLRRHDMPGIVAALRDDPILATATRQRIILPPNAVRICDEPRSDRLEIPAFPQRRRKLSLEMRAFWLRKLMSIARLPVFDLWTELNFTVAAAGAFARSA